MTARGLLADLTDLVLPRRCVGCGGGGVLCARCAPDGRPIRPDIADLGGLVVRAAGEYDGGLRRAVIAYKERGRRDLAGALGALLAVALRDLLGVLSPAVLSPAGRVLLVAPPSSRATVAARGGDHVLRLARVAARAGAPVGAPVGARAGPAVAAPGVLISVRSVRDSAGLGVAERDRNLAGSMRALPPTAATGDTALIVDDVVTTGATVREAKRALRSSGWSVAGAAVVAATPRRFTAHPLAGPS